MEDNKLVADEARRSVQHESVKAEIESDVNAEIASHAAVSTPSEANREAQIGSSFRAKAVDEVVDTEREVQRGRGLARVSQVVDFMFYVIYALLGLRLLLELLNARRSAGFWLFIANVTDPFYAPFRGIVASPTAEGGYRLTMPIIIAIIVYLLLHLGIKAFLRMMAHRRTQI